MLNTFLSNFRVLFSALGFAFIVGGASHVSAQALSLPETTLLPLEHAFIAEHGFDDNDNVQIVIEGRLPNSCYSLAQVQFEHHVESKEIEIRQNAIVYRGGICADIPSLPADLAAPRPFWKVVDIGLLSKGEYHVTYLGLDTLKSRRFYVESAPTEEIDNMDYVQVTNAFAPSAVDASGAYFEVRITGELTSSCTVLDESRVERVGDVFVVLLSTLRSADICMPASHPFYKIIMVPTPDSGRYLLHARSIGGQSVNRIFSVVDNGTSATR
jgi:hypothetical protein